MSSSDRSNDSRLRSDVCWRLTSARDTSKSSTWRDRELSTRIWPDTARRRPHLPNHPVFGNPNTSFGNANYGKITTTAGTYTPRQIQFALKLLF